MSLIHARNFRHAQYLAAVLDRGMDGAMDVADAEHADLIAEVQRLRSALAADRVVVSGGYTVIYPGTARSGAL